MNPIVRSDDVRTQNRKRVLAAMRKQGVSSRTEIAHETGLSAATISAITADFLEENILVPPTDTSLISSGRGRPTISLSINPEAALICSISMSVNYLSVLLVNYLGDTVCEQTIELETRCHSESQLRSVLLSAITDTMVAAKMDAAKLQRIALGVQGLVDVAGTKIIWSPMCEDRNMPVKKWLEHQFGVTTHIANDCDMIVQALSKRDPEKYSDNFAAVLLAHGVGMGLFLRQTVVNGTSSSATEFGHMSFKPDGALCRCGKHGCIEAYAGDYAIVRHANGLTECTQPSAMVDKIDLQAITERARNGDELALSALQQAGTAIGTGLSSLFALVDPFPIVLVGSGAVSFDLMEPHIRKALKGTMIAKNPERVDLDYIADERPLVSEGGTITALQMHDDVIANQKHFNQASA